MADPIGVASGLLNLVMFGIEASQSLYQAIDGIKNHPRNVRELQKEVKSTSVVLQSLKDTLSQSSVDFSALELPITQCGKACKDFDAFLRQFNADAPGLGTRVLDWAKLRYMGDDINWFRKMLAEYKSTIAIAIGGANLRTSMTTATALEEHKDMAKETAADLEQRLQEIDEKLKAFAMQAPSASDEDFIRIDQQQGNGPETPGVPTYEAAQQAKMQEQIDALARCLEICSEAAREEAPEVRVNSFEDISVGEGSLLILCSTVGDVIYAKGVTAGAGSTQCIGQMSDASLQQIVCNKSPAAARDLVE